MREFSLSIFLTLVVSIFIPTFSWSAPNDNLNHSVLKEPIQNVNDPSLTESMLKNRKEDQIMQLTTGVLIGQVTKKLDDGQNMAYGFTFDWRDLDQNYWSLTARWLNTKAAWLEAGKKFIMFPESLYEPYYKLSLSYFMDPKDAFASLTRIDSFKTSVSIGLLDLWTLGRIFTCEVGVHWGIPGAAAHAQAGAQWSF